MFSSVLSKALVLAVVPAGRANDSDPTGEMPEQFHLSYAPQRSGMWVTWVVPEATTSSSTTAHGIPTAATSQAAVGPPLCMVATSAEGTTPPASVLADTKTYTDNAAGCRSDKAYGGPCVPWAGKIHSALVTLPPAGTTVRYSCGVQGGVMSAWRNFTSPQLDGDTVSFGLLGDQGTSMRNINGGMERYNHTYPGAIFVRDELMSAGLDFVHVFGDIAYANGNQPVWDGYGRDMEPLLSHTPALFSPGNHDGEFTFGNSYDNAGEGGGDSGVGYAMRFPGPGPAVVFNSPHTGKFNSTSLYWSVDAGPVHLVATAGVLGFEKGTAQYEWLESDLATANTAASRSKRPWIIVTGSSMPMIQKLCLCSLPLCLLITSDRRGARAGTAARRATGPTGDRHAGLGGAVGALRDTFHRRNTRPAWTLSRAAMQRAGRAWSSGAPTELSTGRQSRASSPMNHPSSLPGTPAALKPGPASSRPVRPRVPHAQGLAAVWEHLLLRHARVPLSLDARTEPLQPEALHAVLQPLVCCPCGHQRGAVTATLSPARLLRKTPDNFSWYRSASCSTSSVTKKAHLCATRAAASSTIVPMACCSGASGSFTTRSTGSFWTRSFSCSASRTDKCPSCTSSTTLPLRLWSL